MGGVSVAYEHRKAVDGWVHPHRKTERERQIRRMLTTGGMNMEQVASELGVTHQRVQQIIRRSGFHDTYMKIKAQRTEQAALGRWVRRIGPRNAQLLAEGANAIGALGFPCTIQCTHTEWFRYVSITGHSVRLCVLGPAQRTRPNGPLYYRTNIRAKGKYVYYVVMSGGLRAIMFSEDVPRSGCIYIRADGSVRPLSVFCLWQEWEG